MVRFSVTYSVSFGSFDIAPPAGAAARCHSAFPSRSVMLHVTSHLHNHAHPTDHTDHCVLSLSVCDSDVWLDNTLRTRKYLQLLKYELACLV